MMRVLDFVSVGCKFFFPNKEFLVSRVVEALEMILQID